MATDQEIQNAQKVLDQWFLGKTSKHYESGNTGPATISSGIGDHGGVSYGSYQLSTNMGTLKEYLKETNNYNHAFDGLTPKTAAFDKKWVELAKNDPQFHQSQHNFIASKHYEPQKDALARAGYDFSDRGKAVQDMLWSTAVQYRGYTVGKIERAERESGLDFTKATDKEIITAVQDSKHRHFKEDFESSYKQWRGIGNRTLDEKQQLLKLQGYEEIIRNQSQEPKKTPEYNSSPDKYTPPQSANTTVDTQNSLSKTHQTLITDSEKHVHNLYKEHGLTVDKGTHNTVMCVAVAAAEQGMCRIDRSAVKDGNINVAQMDGAVATMASVNGNVAANTPVEQSLSKLASIEQSRAQSINNPSQTLNQPQHARSVT